MANLINATSIQYTTKNHMEYFLKAIRKGRTLAHDYIRVIPDVTKEVRVKKMVLTGSISQIDNRDCDWTPTQRTDITPKLIEVNNMKIQFEQCLDDLDNLYSEMLYTSGANKTELPDYVEEALMILIREQLGDDVEKLIWGGAGNAVDTVQNGIVDKALVDPLTIKVAGTSLNATNVLTEIGKVYDAIPDVVLSEGFYAPEKAAVRIFVDFQVYRYLKNALGTVPTDIQVLLPNWSKDGDRIFYQGVEVVVVGVPKNVMVGASRDNIVFVTDLLSDTTNILAEQGNTAKDRNIFYITGKYRAGSDFIFSDEIVIYSV